MQRSPVETGGWARQVTHPIVWGVITFLAAVALVLALATQSSQHQPAPVPSPAPPIQHSRPPGHVVRV